MQTVTPNLIYDASKEIIKTTKVERLSCVLAVSFNIGLNILFSILG